QSWTPATTTSRFLNIGGLIFGTNLATTTNTISTGNVGIGTTTPSTKLHVYGTTTAHHILPQTDASYNLGSATARWANLYAVTTTIGNTIALGSSSIKGSGTTTLSTDAGDLILNPAGYVGIGVANPQAPFHLESTTGPQLRIGYDSDKYFELNVTAGGSIQFRPSIDSAQAFQFQTAGGSATVVDIDTSGEMVGLGTTTPARKLDVSGSARVYDRSGSGVTTLELRAGASQSTNPLLSWQDSSGSTLGVISNQGYIGFGTTTPPTPLYVSGTSTLAGNIVFSTTSTISASAGILQVDICNIQNVATSSISAGGQDLCGTNEVPNRFWYDSANTTWKVECCTLK
ncbi:hypothetical protein J7K42_02655, partial [bacterium]|nr:hypothetical protein [bacterium]